MADLTHPVFSENLNSTFKLQLNETNSVEIVLIEVSEIRRTDRSEAFALLFRGPSDVFVPQGLYPVEHEQMGSFELFTVPVGVTPEGYQYEAVFNRVTEKTK